MASFASVMRWAALFTDQFRTLTALNFAQPQQNWLLVTNTTLVHWLRVQSGCFSFVSRHSLYWPSKECLIRWDFYERNIENILHCQPGIPQLIRCCRLFINIMRRVLTIIVNKTKLNNSQAIKFGVAGDQLIVLTGLALVMTLLMLTLLMTLMRMTRVMILLMT